MAITSTREWADRRLLTVSYALIGGLGLGSFAAFAEDSVFTTSLGQMITPWVLVAAAVGYATHGRFPAAAGGAGALLTANLLYHVIGLGRGYANSVGPLMRWTALGVAAGSLFGMVGHALRSADLRYRTVAGAGLAAVAIAESIVLWGHIDHPEAHATYLLVGLTAVVAALTAGRRLGSATRMLAATAVTTVPLAVLLEVVLDRLGVV